VKCYQYYPVGCENEGEDEMVFNDVGLKVTYITERHTNYHFTTRTLQLLDLQVRSRYACTCLGEVYRVLVFA